MATARYTVWCTIERARDVRLRQADLGALSAQHKAMCLLLVAHECCPGYRLVLAANRDEFHARPTAPAAPWVEHPEIIGGRDLEAGGTWLAIDTRGRFATLTNVRSPRGPQPGRRSRGLIVSDFLRGERTAGAYTDGLARVGADYDGFNVLAYDGSALHWYSNQAPAPRALGPGIYTLSNAQLDTVWPKTERLRAGFGHLLGTQSDDIVETLLGLLRDQHLPDDGALPETGVGLAMERILASIFIRGGAYGTRCSTVVLIDQDDRVTFHERRYRPDATVGGDTRLEFALPKTLPWQAHS